MRKKILVLAAMLFAVSGYGQVTADLGIWGGGSGYQGDLEEMTLDPSAFPVLGAYFRYNFHQRAGVRMMFLTGRVAEKGSIQNYNWEFDKPVQDLTLQIEINYLNYMLGNNKASFTSYLTGGLGVMYFPDSTRVEALAMINQRHPDLGNIPGKGSVITATIPFGMGIKANVGKRIGIGLEYQMRKLFSDKLDDLDDPLSYTKDNGEIITYTDWKHNNDWVGFLGIHLIYKIYLGSKPCPAYDSKN